MGRLLGEFGMTSEMTVKHTPGPWEWRRNGAAIFLYPGVLVTCFSEGTPWGDELDQANAHLIAAAPELLEALKEAREALIAWMIGPLTVDEVLNHRSIKAIDNAIAKAEGRP